jgi:hypothetical protein
MNQLDKPSYTLFLNSTDKVSGTNNNANYDVNWDDFLPRDIEYFKVVYSFQTAGGFYRDNFSQFKVTSYTAPVQATYQTSAIIYNPITNSTLLLISVLTNGPLLLNNNVLYGGKSYLITQQANAVGDTLIVQGNLSVPLNTTLYAEFYTQLTCDTVNGYTGSLSVGQAINNNGKSFPIVKIGTPTGPIPPAISPPNTATLIIVMGVIYSPQIPFNSVVYASNNTTYNGCKIVANFLGQSKSFDTSSKCPSLTLGYGFRDVQISTSNSNCLSTFYMQNAPKTIQRPNQNLLNIQIYNNSNVYTNGVLTQNQLLVNTDYFSNPLTDMTSYSMIIEFIPLH